MPRHVWAISPSWTSQAAEPSAAGSGTVKRIPRSAERGILCLYSLLGQFRGDVGAIHTDGMRFVNVMLDCPELKGVLRVVEFDIEIKFRGKPGCVFCREKEFVAINLQAT